jgi:hypothetical protein
VSLSIRDRHKLEAEHMVRSNVRNIYGRVQGLLDLRHGLVGGNARWNIVIHLE